MNRERATPIAFRRTTGILSCFRRLAKIGEIDIDIALQSGFSLANYILHAFETSRRAQRFKLGMDVEHQRGPSEAPRKAGTGWVEANYKKAVFGKAEREMRIVRIIAYCWIPAMLPVIKFVEVLKLTPEQQFEFFLA